MEKIKSYLRTYREEIMISAIIVFVGTASFGAGVLSVREKVSGGEGKIEIRNATPTTKSSESKDSNIKGSATEASALKSTNDSNFTPVKNETTGDIVASKNGVAYYLPGCNGSSRILDKNKIYFKTEEEAKSAGYRIAANCKK